MLKNKVLHEKVTIEKMIKIYCKSHNKNNSLCEKCSKLLSYLHNRFEGCKYRNSKPPCSMCDIYCYNKQGKESIREVMRYAAPRMLIYHPVITILHFTDKISSKKARTQSADNFNNGI